MGTVIEILAHIDDSATAAVLLLGLMWATLLVIAVNSFKK